MPLSDGRWAATATTLKDGRILVAGGYSYARKDTLRSADLVDPRTLAVSAAAPLNEDRNFAAAALLPDGQVLVAGGFSETRGTRDTAERYDPRENVWVLTRGRMHDHRELFTATPLPGGGGRVLLAGGLSLRKRATVATAEVYDPGADAFTPTASPMQIERFEHAAAPLPDGRVLIVGGKTWAVGKPAYALASCEVFDLRDGRVLVAGGTNEGKPARECEVFDPRTETFAPAAPLHEGRMAHDACRLGDGRVVVAGGWSDARRASTPTVEVYDPRRDR
jgi:outer membrane murein-binding lipoprotein Lpp